MKPLDFNKELKEGMEVVLINKKPYLFTNMRIDRKTIPAGYFAYDVRESDGGAGDFYQIQPYVIVNHWGCIIGKDELPLSEKWGDYICDEDKEDGFFLDCVRSLKEYDEIHIEEVGKI